MATEDLGFAVYVGVFLAGGMTGYALGWLRYQVDEGAHRRSIEILVESVRGLEAQASRVAWSGLAAPQTETHADAKLIMHAQADLINMVDRVYRRSLLAYRAAMEKGDQAG